MATLTATNPTLLDYTKHLDPMGKIDRIVEILTEQNPILQDMAWQEGNLLTGHTTTIRTGLPTPTWTKLYQRVQPTKGTVTQVTDTVGKLKAYSEIAVDLLEINNNSAAFRASEDGAHLQGMMNEMAATIFYGNEGTAPSEFTGLAPRFNSLSADNKENIIVASPGTADTSIWLVDWGPQTVHGIFGKGMKAGWKSQDLGQQTSETASGLLEVVRTLFTWDAGLTVRDWQHVVRIQVDKEEVTKDGLETNKVDLIDLMAQACELIPDMNRGRPVFYMSRLLRSFLRRQIATATKNSTLTWEMVGGKRVMMFDDIPVKRCDALLGNETEIT